MLGNFIEETANAPGTGSSVLLGGAAAGRLTWGSKFAGGATVFYVLADAGQAEWGVGTFNSGTPASITRSTVLGNTSGTTSRLNFTGTTRVYNEVPAERLVYFDQNGDLVASAQAMAGTTWCGTAGGTANAVVLTPPQAIASLSAGLNLRFLAAARCTGAVTIDATGGTPVALRRPNGAALGPGDMLAGEVVSITYTGSEWRLDQSPLSQGRLIGELVEFTGATLPDGFLWPNGQNVLRSQYPDLHAIYQAQGYPYGAGDGTTTFAVPDARGRALAGRDNMGGTAANRITAAISGVAGATLGASGGDQRAHQHNHTASDGGHTHTGVTDSQGSHNHTIYGSFGSGGGYRPQPQSNYSTSIVMVTEAAGAHTHSVTTGTGTASITVANALAGNSQNMPPVLVQNLILYAGA